MKNFLLQNAMAHSLIATLLCGVITVVLFRLPLLSEPDGVAALMPKVSPSVCNCPLPAPRLSTDGKLKLLIEREDLLNRFPLEIKESAEILGLKELNVRRLPKGDIELRVWELPSFLPPQGFALRRTNGQWKGLLLQRLENREAGNFASIYPEPNLGWDEFWNRLVKQGILTLPDAECLRDYNPGLDGTSYFVEINLNSAYRIYSYWSPSLKPAFPESMKMWQIICLIFSYDCSAG
jgi:hypothetical protein